MAIHCFCLVAVLWTQSDSSSVPLLGVSALRLGRRRSISLTILRVPLRALLRSLLVVVWWAAAGREVARRGVRGHDLAQGKYECENRGFVSGACGDRAGWLWWFCKCGGSRDLSLVLIQPSPCARCGEWTMTRTCSTIPDVKPCSTTPAAFDHINGESSPFSQRHRSDTLKVQPLPTAVSTPLHALDIARASSAAKCIVISIIALPRKSDRFEDVVGLTWRSTKLWQLNNVLDKSGRLPLIVLRNVVSGCRNSRGYWSLVPRRPRRDDASSWVCAARARHSNCLLVGELSFIA